MGPRVRFSIFLNIFFLQNPANLIEIIFGKLREIIILRKISSGDPSSGIHDDAIFIIPIELLGVAMMWVVRVIPTIMVPMITFPIVIAARCKHCLRLVNPDYLDSRSNVYVLHIN